MTDKLDEWDGKLSNVQISKTAFPELFFELSIMQNRARADRLRSLAMIGLYVLRATNGVTNSGSIALSACIANTPEDSDAAISSQNHRTLKTLIGSLDDRQ